MKGARLLDASCTAAMVASCPTDTASLGASTSTYGQHRALRLAMAVRQAFGAAGLTALLVGEGTLYRAVAHTVTHSTRVAHRIRATAATSRTHPPVVTHRHGGIAAWECMRNEHVMKGLHASGINRSSI
jgi:hypothetical protein